MARTGRPKSRFDDLYVPVTESGCWIWMGSQIEDGYGYFSAARKSAHRFSYERVNGLVPAGLCVCHRCDVPACVNPAHLFLGTNQDNMDDKVRKGRQQRGARNNTAKLTESQVREIRASDGTNAALAARYGITDVAISCIRLGKTWKHVA